MKKFLIALVLISLTAAVFADDAKVMPKGVIRAYFLGTYGMFDSEYDSDGDEQDFAGGETSYFNQGFATELGVTEQITAAVQWVPGSNLYSDVEANENWKISGPGDLFIGTKIQILGDHGFVKNEQFRFSMAPGIRIPLDSYDALEEATNQGSGDDWRASGMSYEAFGFGSRIYFDYLVNKSIYINLYSEIIFTLPVDKKYATIYDAGNTTESEYNYGTDLVFEIEPNYVYPVTEKSNIYFGLPLNYKITQDVEINGVTQDDTGSKYLQLRPILGYFCGDTKIPFDVSLRYGFPLYGVNSKKMQTITLQAKVYARLFE